MFALDAEYLRAERVGHPAIKGWIGRAGPYDFLPLTGAITRAVFGYPDVGHVRLLGAMSTPLRGTAPVVEDVVRFIGGS
ncbi:MAG TPA: hypothetical protein VHP37_20305 [Burkholderiales bacterium]|nr:hypothetical protein [Burkholderiales bacterium]